jgi:hypothetical protein
MRLGLQPDVWKGGLQICPDFDGCPISWCVSLQQAKARGRRGARMRMREPQESRLKVTGCVVCRATQRSDSDGGAASVHGVIGYVFAAPVSGPGWHGVVEAEASLGRSQRRGEEGIGVAGAAAARHSLFNTILEHSLRDANGLPVVFPSSWHLVSARTAALAPR